MQRKRRAVHARDGSGASGERVPRRGFARGHVSGAYDQGQSHHASGAASFQLRSKWVRAKVAIASHSETSAGVSAAEVLLCDPTGNRSQIFCSPSLAKFRDPGSASPLVRGPGPAPFDFPWGRKNMGNRNHLPPKITIPAGG
jgi:hypothetical protein